MKTQHAPVAALSTIGPDLESTIDCRNSAATTTHPLRDFAQCHIAVAQERDNPIEFLFRKVSAFRSDHVWPPTGLLQVD